MIITHELLVSFILRGKMLFLIILATFYPNNIHGMNLRSRPIEMAFGLEEIFGGESLTTVTTVPLF